MATEPDDIIVDAASPANDDRVKEILHGNVEFESKQSTAQAPKKARGQCRMVVEFPFDFAKDFLDTKGAEHGVRYIDGVDYLRTLKSAFERGDLDLGDIENLSLEHSDNGVRVEAAK